MTVMLFVVHKTDHWTAICLRVSNSVSCAYEVGAAVAQWLRCCATNRKVAGLFPDGVIGILH